MRVRTFIALAACAVTMLAAAPAAYASYSGDGGVTLDPATPKVGSTLTVDSTGWMAATAVTVTLHSTPVVLATVTSDANGNVHAEAQIPSDTATGAHTLELTGTDPAGAPRTVTTAITIDAASGGGGSLPRTGAAIAALVLVGAVLFAVGAALSTARKRRAAVTTTTTTTN
jgi:LPXTG-motif cell wall-anchored protein